MTKTLKITMSEGKWLVDIFSQANDSGVYGLIHPNTFEIELDDEVLAEGELDKSEAASGSGVV